MIDHTGAEKLVRARSLAGAPLPELTFEPQGQLIPEAYERGANLSVRVVLVHFITAKGPRWIHDALSTERRVILPSVANHEEAD